MISERQNSLLQAVKWDRTPTTPVEASSTGSLKSRLASLTKSADNWQNRVRKDDCLLSLDPSKSRKTMLLSQSNSIGKENKGSPCSKVGLLLNIDKGLESFFPHSTAAVTPSIALELDIDAVQTTPVLKTPRRPRLCNRSRAVVRNIIPDFDTFTPTSFEEPKQPYEMEHTVVDDKSSPVAQSARNGLMAVEDYGSAKSHLKKSDTSSPYPEKMLIRIQGERKVDVRLVAPVSCSIHHSAVFILVTPNRLLKYEGKFSNILERTKATQLCIKITTHGDLHCSAKKCETVSEHSLFKLLDGPVRESDPSFALEPFELTIARCNLVLRVTEKFEVQSVVRGELVRFSLLQPKETLIFDFGSEIYIWSGRSASKVSAQCATEYARQLLKRPVNNSLFLFGEELGNDRAPWVLYRKLVQGVQDILFASKFSDWQSSGTKHLGTPMKPIRQFNSPTSLFTTSTSDAHNLADFLLSIPAPEPILTIEDHEFSRTMKDVETEALSFWQLKGEELVEIPSTNVIFSNCCYVLRWQYRIQVSGIRRLRTGVLSEKETGRERVAFFYWLGEQTTPKQRGLCALKLSHMDKDKSPHIRIEQGLEPPIFLTLFKGKLIIRNPLEVVPAIFVIHGATLIEGHAVQLQDVQPLRTHAVYICLDEEITLVAGSDCHPTSVTIALVIANEMAARIADFYAALRTTPVVSTSVQGELDHFDWVAARGRKTCPRAFRIYENEATELPCPQYHPDLPFPLQQTCLSDTVLVDVGDRLWVWCERAPSTFVLRVAEQLWIGRSGTAIVVLQTCEPAEFTSIFSSWKNWELPEQETTHRTPPKTLPDILTERTCTYSPEQLRNRSGLPDGVDLKNLERYLSDADFQDIFKMKKDQFESLPLWKQIRLRREAGFF